MMTIDNWSGSPKFGMLYMVWNENQSPPGQNTVISQCNTRPSGVPNAANCDNPDNWTAPVRITDATGSYIYASVAAAPNGDLYVAWQNYASPFAGGNRISIDRCPAGNNCGASAASWGTDQLIANLDASGGTPVPFFCPIISAPAGRVGPQPYVDVGPTGLVSVAYSDLRSNGTSKCTAAATDQSFDSFIDTSSSSNTFPTANAGKRLSDDAPAAANDHFFPSLTVDQTTGEIQSNLYSTKADGLGQKTHQYTVISNDGGASFGAMTQITSAASDFSGANSTPNDYGDYEGADSARGLFLPVWTDNRTSNANSSDLWTHAAPSGNIHPAAAFSFSPAVPQPGQVVAFGSSSADPDGTITSYSWNFGDGSAAGAGSTPTNAYAAAGTYNVTLTVTDNGGFTGTVTRPVSVAAPPPVIGPVPPVGPVTLPVTPPVIPPLASAAVQQLGMSRTAFPAAPTGPSAIAGRKRTYGARVTYTVNRTASVGFTVQQSQPGRKTGTGRRARCVAPTRQNRKAKKCTRIVTLPGSFTLSGRVGSNSFGFTGRLAGRKLKLGRYTLVATPRAGGTTGRSATLGFRIIP
jgi:PKD repeat protein